MNYFPNYNQFYNQPTQPQMPRLQPMEQPYPQFTQPQFKQSMTIQGKIVESVEVVKAMDIPLDGSVSYFPLADGSAIVTKQLQQDGSSKTSVYKLTTETDHEQLPKYITIEELDEAIKKIDNAPIKDELKTIRRQIKDIMNDVEDLRKD